MGRVGGKKGCDYTEAEVGVMCSEDRIRGQAPRNASDLQKLENGSSRALRRRSALLTPCFGPF